MIYSEYVDEVKKYYLKHFSNDLFDSANKYFNSEEAQETIKEGYECYTSKNVNLHGTGKPEAVGNCLSLMW